MRILNNRVRHYETMFIVKPTLTEEETHTKINFFKDAITKNGGEIETCLDMGLRSLAYEIKKSYRGYYYVIYFKAASTLVAELERLYGINEDILRFIVIKYESKSEQNAWQSLVNRANKKEKPKTLKKDDGMYITHKERQNRYQFDRQDSNKQDSKDKDYHKYSKVAGEHVKKGVEAQDSKDSSKNEFNES